MARASHASSQNGSSSPGVIAVVAFCLAFGWVFLVAGTHLHEMMVGAAVVVLATLYLNAVHKSSQNKIRLGWKDAVQCRRIPWYMASGIWEITFVFFKDLTYLTRAGSYYRVSGFQTSKRDRVVIARTVLATRTWSLAAPAR
jgi:hypothetical protein